jgi:hypothetical protein
VQTPNLFFFIFLTEIVAEGTAVLKYNSIDKNVLSFRASDKVRIMGRNIPNGPKFDLGILLWDRFINNLNKH